MFELLYAKLLDEKTKKLSEKFIINLAIISFLLHLAVITLNDLGLLGVAITGELFTNPISAIYTPFSFILVYEVYLLEQGQAFRYFFRPSKDLIQNITAPRQPRRLY